MIRQYEESKKEIVNFNNGLIGLLCIRYGEGSLIVINVGSQFDTSNVYSLNITNKDFNLRWILAWKRNN